MAYYTDQQKLSILADRIDRLQATLKRAEALGLSSSSGAGLAKTYIDPEKVKLHLDRALVEYESLEARTKGKKPFNRQVKKVKQKNPDTSE